MISDIDWPASVPVATASPKFSRIATVALILPSGTSGLVETPSMCALLVGTPVKRPMSKRAERCGIPAALRAAGYSRAGAPRFPLQVVRSATTFRSSPTDAMWPGTPLVPKAAQPLMVGSAKMLRR